ncbi:FAD binding domain protein [Fusarium austroafricanum]|uniref:FAD binding domain protein n=1 Tax=Fusarium austroafricanum TaxID=2364996 RepID=A0A8H4JWD7_9HYPO|nr:FAD binding domain protein [Fusarium austroafricanum]
MAYPTNFKLIIAGGGIAGLSLAIMLEKFDLDYILLEAYSDIAPAVGASIGMFPNGLRVLDQLGCYQPIRDVYGDEVPVNFLCTRNENGSIRNSLNGVFNHLEKRTILVGADGLHSQVRKSMHQLGHSLEPGYFDTDEEDNVPCHYICGFGISQDVPGWPVGHQCMVTGRGRSQLVVSGPENRVYWFMFEKLPETKCGKGIPRYNKQDEAEFVKRNQSVRITPEITFGQVYANAISSTLTPLHEVVRKKWFFKRIITLGDSAHKPNPIGGQGTNGAIESCPELINGLMRLKDTRDNGLSNLSNNDITKVFSQVQSARHDRAKAIVRRAYLMQILFANEYPIVSKLWGLLGSSPSGEGTLNASGFIFLGGTTIKQLPVIYRPRAIPFYDERPAKPINEWISSIVQCGFICAMGLAVLATTKAIRLPFGTWAQSSVHISWFGETVATRVLNSLVTLFKVPMHDQNPSARVHLSNSLPQLISPLLVYAIEGHRLGNQGTPLAAPWLFSIAMQVQGIARAAPIYAILTSLFGFENGPSRAVPLQVAQSLIPAITIGFLIPTIMMLLPTPKIHAWQNWCALWQFAPLLFNLLVTGISAGIKKWKCEEKRDGKVDMSRYETKDVSTLQSVYMLAFAVQALAHITSLAYGWSHPDVSLFDTFLGLPNIFQAEWSLSSVAVQIATFFKYDMAIGVLGYLGSQLYSIWDLRRLGYIRTSEVVIAGIAILAGQVIVGPGATWAGLWYWRERKIATVGV